MVTMATRVGGPCQERISEQCEFNFIRTEHCYRVICAH